MRTRRTKEQIRKDIYNKDVDAYNFYVVNLDTMKAETGFEFKEDAVDVLNDYDDKKKYKVVSKKSLKSLGIENPNESFKYETGGDFQAGVYAKGGGVKINTEVILSENRPNGAEWQGVVKPFMLKSIEENQYAGGFKRYEIDIYDEVDREPTKEEIKKANEFFDKIGGRYAGGGKIKPFMYKEKNSTIMINGTKADVKKMYLDYKNNFLSVSKFAEYYNISETQANSIINQGRKYAKEDGYYARGGKVLYKDLFEDYENQPEELKEIVNFYEIKWEKADYDYKDSFNFQKEVEKIGYTFNYGLDNEPFALRKKDVKLNQVIGYKDMDTKNDMIFAKGGEFMTDPTFGNFQNNVYAGGGGVETDINFRNFTINELIKKLPQDVEFMWIVEEKTPNFIRRSDKEFKKISNTEFTITDFGTLELSKGSENLYLDIKVMEVSDDAPEVSYFISLFTKDNHKGLKEFSKGLIEKFEMGGVTNNYVSRRNLNTITIKKGNQKLTYKISDVLNGAYKLESGAKLEDIAFYVPKRSIVKVQLKTGKDFKPANGYWIKDGAKPIHISKFDDGGEIKFLNGGGFGEVAFIITNDYYGNLDLGFNDITINDFIYTNSFMRYSDAMKTLIDFLKSEDGEYIIKQDPKSKFEIAMISYNPKLDKYKDLEPQRKILYTIKASMINDFTKKSIFYEGGVMSRLLTRKKDQPKVETIDEDIDLNEDSRIRVRPSSFVRKDKEGDWMMKKNSSKEARSYAGGGSIERRYNTMSKEDKEELMREKIGVGRTPFSQYRKYNQLSNYHKNLVDKYFSGKLNYAGGGEIRVGDKTLALINPSKYTDGSVVEVKVLQIYSPTEIKVLYQSTQFIAYRESWDMSNSDHILKGDWKIDDDTYQGGGKVTFSEKAKAIAKNFEGKRVEPKYQKEYGKVYDKTEAKEVGNKIAGSQKASYDAKLEKGSEVKKGKGNHKMKATTDLARKIRKDGEKWTDAIKRASLQLK